MSIKEKIEQRLNDLQTLLESNKHLDAPKETENLIDSVSKFWSVLDEGDKEYIQAARHAVENKMEWK